MELIQFIDTAAREKNIPKEEAFQIVEEAIQKIAKAKYGHERDIRASIDSKGAIHLTACLQVVESVENEATQVDLKGAQRINPESKIGDVLTEELPPLKYGRIAAQIAKQVITQGVRESERKRQYAEFANRVKEVVNGVVRRVEYGNITVDLGTAEGTLYRNETLPSDKLKVGDRVRAYIYDVRREQRGPQIFLSRTHPMFMAKLFAQEVPEIYDGIIEIKAVARDPGSRAKIAVFSNDSSIDPVGACVGMRGSRVQAVVGELQGEKVDIIPWSPSAATFVVNALAPAEAAKVVLDEEKHRIDVVVPDDQLSLAIGRRGQNVRLASMLTGWDIDIMTEAEESERRTEEFKTRSNLFMEALDVDDVIAHLLVTEGFTSVEDVAAVSVEELAAIEGFDADVAAELKQRAEAWLAQKSAKTEAHLKELGLTEDLKKLNGLTPDMLVKLGENNIKTLDDLGDLAGDELRELLGKEALSEEAANNLIMAARAHWFDNSSSK